MLRGLFIDIKDLPQHKDKKNVRIGGIVSLAKKIMTKNNEMMVFAKLEDMSEGIEVVVFPRIYKDKPEIWEVGKTLVVSGRYQEKDGEPKLLAESGYEITPDNVEDIKKFMKQSGILQEEAGDQAEHPATNIEQETTQEVTTPTTTDSSADTPLKPAPKKRTIQAVNLHLRAHLPESALLKLRGVLDQHPGQYRVYFSVEHPVKQKILTSYRIGFDDLVAKELEGLLGADTVKAEL
jgi:DNA polymerase III alpha subunit